MTPNDRKLSLVLGLEEKKKHKNVRPSLIDYFLMENCNTSPSELVKVINYSEDKKRTRFQSYTRCLHQIPALGVQGNPWKRRQKEFKSQREWRTPGEGH